MVIKNIGRPKRLSFSATGKPQRFRVGPAWPPTRIRGAFFSAVARFVADSFKIGVVSAQFQAVGRFVATGVRSALGSATFTAVAGFAAIGLKRGAGSATFSAAASFVAAGLKRGVGLATFSAASAMAATGFKRGLAAAPFSAEAIFAATCKKVALGAAQFSAETGFVATGIYRAAAVNFDGTNDYLTRGADLTGNADGKVGLISVWIDPAADGIGYDLLQTSGGFFFLQRLNTHQIWVRGHTSAAVAILHLVSTTTYAAASGWHHILSSWNLATGQGQLYVDDVDVLNTGNDIVTNDTLDYTRPNWGVGGNHLGGNKFNGDMADLLFWPDASLDLSVEANRRLFISAAGQPVNPSVAIATLGTPIIELSGPTAAWHTNKGDGGGFTENGALTDGGSSPSD